MQRMVTNARVAHHRNGVRGESFHVVVFGYDDPDTGRLRHMVATVGDQPGQCHVLDLDETLAGNIAMGEGNSWRGDDFECVCRLAIADFEAGRAVLFADRRA